VNPEALARGTTFVQCANSACAVWHKMADNLNWWGEEYDFRAEAAAEAAAAEEEGATTKQVSPP